MPTMCYIQGTLINLLNLVLTIYEIDHFMKQLLDHFVGDIYNKPNHPARKRQREYSKPNWP